MRIDVSTRWYEVVFATAGVLPDHAAPPQDIDVKGYDWSNATMPRLGEGTLAPEKAPVYLLRHYLAHLLAAEAPVDDLMAVTQAKWMRARQALDGSDYGIAYDLTRIRDDLLRRHAAGGPPCFDERYRTALFLSSIRSVSSNVPAELLRAALDAKVITLRQVLHLARSGSNDEYRAEKLTLVLPHLPEDERSQVVGEALTAALRIEDDKARAEAVRRLAPHLLPKQQGEALTAARTIGGEEAQAQASTGLAPRLSAGQLAKAMAAAKAIEDEWERAQALAGLAPHLSAEQRGEALAAAIGSKWARAEALAGLAPHLPRTQRDEALEVAQAIEDEMARAKALAGLAPHLLPHQHAEVLRDALAAARAIGDQGWRVEALARLAPHLSPKQRGEALAAAHAITLESWRRASIVTELPPPLPVQQREAEIAEFLAAAENKHRRFVLIYTETLIAMELVSPSAMANAIIDAQAMWP